MPVNSTHADYDAALPGWARARDLLAGEDAVKAAGEKYLPRLDAQSYEDYLAYQSRACFFRILKTPAQGLLDGKPWTLLLRPLRVFAAFACDSSCLHVS